METLTFPKTQGENLLRERVDLPAYFRGRRSIIFVAFLQIHQRDVDSWVPKVQDLLDRFPGLDYYELPVIRPMNYLSRRFLREGMRAGIPDPQTRRRTVTLHLDKAAFRRALAIPDEEQIHVLLLDERHIVRWRTVGPWSEAKAVALEAALAADGT